MRYCGEKDLKWRFYGVDKFCGVRYFRLIVTSPINRFQIEGSHLFLCVYIRKSTCIGDSELFATFVTNINALNFFCYLVFGGVRYFNLFYAVVRYFRNF